MMSKRKHITLSLKQKAEIIRRTSLGESAMSLAEKYGVGKSTISDIHKNKLKILEYVGSSDSGRRRKTLKRGAYPEMEEELYNWILEERIRGTPLTRNMICKKAKYFHRQTSSNFRASPGWFQKFKDRFDIKEWTIPEEIPSSNLDTVEALKNKLSLAINEMDLQPAQIYTADESSLLWRLLPNQMLTNVDLKFAKESITFMPCVNVAGNHKLRLLVLEKANEPKGFMHPSPPVYYRCHAEGWITEDVFREWFHTEFVPSVRGHLNSLNLPQKALLILDNARGYPEDLLSDDKMISVMYTPLNNTPLIQRVAQVLKLLYRKNLLQTIVESDSDIHATLEAINLRDVVCSLDTAWKFISVVWIKNTWTNIFSQIKQEPSNESHHISRELEMEIDEIKVSCNKISKDLPLTNKEIADWAMGINEVDFCVTDDVTIEDIDKDLNDVTESSCNDEVVHLNAVRHIDAVTCFDTCITWALENDIPSDQVYLLQELRNKAIEAEINYTQ